MQSNIGETLAERKEKKETELKDITIKNHREVSKINRKITVFTRCAWVLFFSGLAGILLYIYFNCESSALAQFGTYTGGVVISCWSLSGTLFIYMGFLGQSHQLLSQEIESIHNELELILTRLELSKQAFESRFFEMVKAQRQMVYEMKFNTSDEFEIRGDPAVKYSTEVTGHRVFTKIFKQLQEATKELGPVYDANLTNLFKDEAIEKVEVNLIKKRFNKFDKDKLKEITLSNLSYLTVLYGVGENGRFLRNSLSSYYNEKFANEVIDKMRLKPAKYSIYWESYVDGKLDYSAENYPKYYGGHLHRLDQYYRLLFNIIFYVNEQRDITYNEKYKYVSFLRTQLTTYEQSVFFINSLSFNGRQWDLKPRKPKDNWQTAENIQLITKYNMIRNIPTGFIENINFREFYPLVAYESGHPKKERKSLILKYT